MKPSLKDIAKDKIRTFWTLKSRHFYVNVHSIEEYFALPKEKREFCGVYLKPIALPCDLYGEKGDDSIGWGAFVHKIRKAYPVQGFFREWFFDYDNPVYALIYRFFDKMRHARCSVRRFFKPAHPRWRKVYPRHSWMDVHYAIEEINFALILDFWYEEVLKGCVDWQWNQAHRDVYDFLKSSVEWIEHGRKEVEALVDAQHEIIFKNRQIKQTYEQRYGEINRLEKMAKDKNTEILKKLAEYRESLWT